MMAPGRQTQSRIRLIRQALESARSRPRSVNCSPTNHIGRRRFFPTLHRLVRRAYQLSRTLPGELLRLLQSQTAVLPRSTEVERFTIQRVGQEVFRRGLLEYWDSRCAISGLAAPELLRASHIKPWADCDNDSERLDVFNAFLLAPHFDAAFDTGFITVGEEGEILVSRALSKEARELLGLNEVVKLRDVTDEHKQYVLWHPSRVFRRIGS